MIFNLFLAHRLAEAYIQEAMREAEQDRLVRADQGTRKARGWWTSVASVLSSLVGLVIRPQS